MRRSGLPPEQEPAEVARLLSYVALLAISIILLVTAIAIPTSRFEVLGAGAFPMLIHSVLIALLVSAIIGSLRRLSRDAPRRFAGQIAAWARARRLVFVVFACLGLYIAAIPAIGYSYATFVFLAVLQLALGGISARSVAIALVAAALFSFGLNWLFAEVFNVFLPRG